MIAMYTRGIEKWLNSRYILKVESIEFADELVLRCGGRKESRMTLRLGAQKTNWKNRV